MIKRATLLGAAFVCVASVVAAHAASLDRVRFLEGPAAATKLTPADLAVEVTGYLAPGAIDVATLVPPPPAIDSASDKVDVALFRMMSAAKDERWLKAVADDASVYDRFAEALGLPPDRENLPRLVRLLNQVAEDALAASGEAKKLFPRPRPFQRFQLKRVCGQASAPKPEPSPTKGASYPSGHAIVSWAVALVMMEVAPRSVPPLINRAVDYGHSRAVCGVHFLSDVETGRMLGAAVVDKLFAVPQFRRDLLCAKREYAAVAAGERSVDLPACY